MSRRVWIQPLERARPFKWFPLSFGLGQAVRNQDGVPVSAGARHQKWQGGYTCSFLEFRLAHALPEKPVNTLKEMFEETLKDV